jgi:hypothetical protein
MEREGEEEKIKKQRMGEAEAAAARKGLFPRRTAVYFVPVCFNLTRCNKCYSWP